MRQPKRGELSTPFNPQPLLVTKRKGVMVTARRPDGSIVTRIASMFHHLPYTSAGDLPPVDDPLDTDDDVPPEDEAPVDDEPPQPLLVPRRSSRVVKRPQRLFEHV